MRREVRGVRWQRSHAADRRGPVSPWRRPDVPPPAARLGTQKLAASRVAAARERDFADGPPAAAGGGLLCPIRREDFMLAQKFTPASVTLEAKLVAARKMVLYSYDESQANSAQQLPARALPADVDVTQLFLAVLLSASGDAAYLLPSEAGLEWAPRYTETRAGQR